MSGETRLNCGKPGILDHQQKGKYMAQQSSYDRQRPGSALHFRLGFCLLLGCLALGTTMAWADNLRRMVEFQVGTPVAVQEEIVATSGCTLLKLLPLVNAAAIVLPRAP